ncbi:MAG: DUF2877 domain-containing protein [Elusimicrobiota bacterium]
MVTLQVTKYDCNLSLKNLNNFSFIEKYNTACLIKTKSGFISLLTGDRKPVPGSVNLNLTENNFKKMNFRSGNIKFDFHMAKTWNSKVRNILKISTGFAVNVIENSAFTFHKKDSPLYLKTPDFKKLIGAGKGLTPAGDDFTIGALGTGAFICNDLFKDIESQITKALTNTTSLSRHFLKLALNKRYSEDFINLFLSLEQKEINEVEKHIQSILNYGQSSGYYTVKGILWALKKI